MVFLLRRRDVLIAMALVGLVFYSDIQNYIVLGKNKTGRSLFLVTELADDYVERAGIVKDYSQTEIEATAPHLQVFHPRLLVWSDDDGDDDASTTASTTASETGFRVYNLDHAQTHAQISSACGRCGKTVPLLVNALLEHFPTRFQPGQPVFQMLWSDADSFQSACVNSGNCNVDQFAPLPLFGSVPKDPTVFPTVKAMPNWFYINCLYNWKFNVDDQHDSSSSSSSAGEDCWGEHVDNKIQWDDLQNTIIYRGSDFTFLPTYDELSFFSASNMADFPDKALLVDGGGDDATSPETIVMKLFHYWNSLSPRWRAIALSVQAELSSNSTTTTSPWLDAKFVGPMRQETHDKFASLGVTVATDQPLDPMQMSRYKYQLDLGGGGGTSWRGTLSKLRMPGVLLHHETPTMDWFYPDMKPFKHYIPIHLDLSDLKAKYEWAEASPDRAQKIAKEGQKLAKHLFSNEYMTKLHQELFVDYLGKVVQSFQPSNATWAQAQQRYVDKGFTLTEVVYCRSTRCFVNVRDDVYRSFPHVVLSSSSSTPLLIEQEEAASSPSLLVNQETTQQMTIVEEDVLTEEDEDAKLTANTIDLASKVTAGAATFVTELAASKLAFAKEGKADPPRELVVVDGKVVAQTQKAIAETAKEDENEEFLSTGDSSQIETIDALPAASFEAMRAESNEQALPYLVQAEDITEIDQSQSTGATAPAPYTKNTNVDEKQLKTDTEPTKVTAVYLEEDVDNTRLEEPTEEAVNAQIDVAIEADPASEVFVDSVETETAPLAPPQMYSNEDQHAVSPPETLVVAQESQATPINSSEAAEGSVVYEDVAESVTFEQPKKHQSTFLRTEDTRKTAEGTQPMLPAASNGVSVVSETEPSTEAEAIEQPKKPKKPFFRNGTKKNSPEGAQTAPLTPAIPNVVSEVLETEQAPQTIEVVEQTKKPTTPFFRDGTNEKPEGVETPEGTQTAPLPPATPSAVSVVSETEHPPETSKVIEQTKKPTTLFFHDGINEKPEVTSTTALPPATSDVVSAVSEMEQPPETPGVIEQPIEQPKKPFFNDENNEKPEVTQTTPLPPATPDAVTVESNAEQSSETVETKEQHENEVNTKPTDVTQNLEKANSLEQSPKEIPKAENRKLMDLAAADRQDKHDHAIQEVGRP